MILDIEAGGVSAELVQRGVPAHARVHVLVQVLDETAVPTTALTQAGDAFDFLAEEPDPYTDADAVERY